MKRIIMLMVLTMLLGCIQKTEKFEGVSAASGSIRIITLYDNNPYDERFETGFGYSSLIQAGNNTILFDTGGDSITLLRNMEKAGVKPETINIIVLSHIHGDHTGGLLGLLEHTKAPIVYLPSSFPQDFKEKVKTNAKLVEVSAPSEISKGIYSTGELGTWIKEQSLIIKSSKGIIIITGCAHPGIVEIVKKAKEITGERVYLVLGGFHLNGASENEIRNIVREFRELGVEKVAPCHCTGETATKIFKEEYKEYFIENGVGKTVVVE
ncbi:MAG: MBL fold metallo-hydrolase [Candidatus Diapherotrites archaeon]|nr:MBL fold metallo-hydrolase [Candidatus Diapherotrites archaeon]